MSDMSRTLRRDLLCSALLRTTKTLTADFLDRQTLQATFVMRERRFLEGWSSADDGCGVACCPYAGSNGRYPPLSISINGEWSHVGDVNAFYCDQAKNSINIIGKTSDCSQGTSKRHDVENKN